VTSALDFNAVSLGYKLYHVQLVSSIAETITVSAMSSTKSTLTWLIAQKDFILYYYHESPKSYIYFILFSRYDGNQN
jgi:hypothetical protein